MEKFKEIRGNLFDFNYTTIILLQGNFRLEKKLLF